MKGLIHPSTFLLRSFLSTNFGRDFICRTA